MDLVLSEIKISYTFTAVENTNHTTRICRKFSSFILHLKYPVQSSQHFEKDYIKTSFKKEKIPRESCCSNLKMTLLKWLLYTNRQTWKEIDLLWRVLFPRLNFPLRAAGAVVCSASVCDCLSDPCSSLLLCSKTISSRSLCHNHLWRTADHLYYLQACFTASA